MSTTDSLRGFYERGEAEGKHFLIDWRKFLRAKEMLSKLRLSSRQRQVRSLVLYSELANNPETMAPEDLIRFFNNSPEAGDTGWSRKPAYWTKVYNAIVERGLNLLEEIEE